MVDIELVVETYRICKEYVSQKDRQTMADHVVNSIAEYDISEQEFRTLASTDSYLKRAVEETLGEELEIGHDEDEADDSW